MWEQRERKLQAKRARMPKHGRSLQRIVEYLTNKYGYGKIGTQLTK